MNSDFSSLTPISAISAIQKVVLELAQSEKMKRMAEELRGMSEMSRPPLGLALTTAALMTLATADVGDLGPDLPKQQSDKSPGEKLAATSYIPDRSKMAERVAKNQLKTLGMTGKQIRKMRKKQVKRRATNPQPCDI